MNRRTLIWRVGGFGLLLMIAVGLFAYQDWTEEPPVDVVRGVPPVSRALQHVSYAVDDMADMSEAERGKYLETNFPHLPQDVVYYLRDLGKIHPSREITRVEFRYGSLGDIMAESGDDIERVNGYFENQLIAIVYVEQGVEPYIVIVECLNGTFITVDRWKTLQAVGEHGITESFVIGRGEGLTHHVSYGTAIDLAERFELPLYVGNRMRSDRRITPNEARLIDTDHEQVTVKVGVGDFFDLRRMEYRKAGRQQQS
ncbi:MAG: hypothetical protein O2794_01875 [bacterium]|nr:hypothetical protein [bacterium]